MRVKLEAGAQLDLITAEEVRNTLDAWYSEIMRGVTFRYIGGQTNQAAGVFSIGGASDSEDVLGPRAGFMWAVTRLAVSGNGFNPAADTFTVYINDQSPSKLVVQNIVRQQLFDMGVLVLTAKDRLLVTGPATGAAGTDVTLSGAAIEVPVQLAWKLLG